MKPGGRSGEAWSARPFLAAALRLTIFALPIAVAIGITVALRSSMPKPYGPLQSLALWGALVLTAAAAGVVAERGLRRVVPLTMLLKMAMLFPDRAPSRVMVAREAGSIKRLSVKLAELREDPAACREASSAAAILALATALQAHDRRTRGHAERVRVYTDLLAEEMKLSEGDRYRLRWAALLHDIGKLRVSGDILNKRGTLDGGEWEVIRRHPLEGARIAGPLIEWLGPWAGAITDHHERFDGTGYPRALSGQSISLAGRIVAVADAYDTMTAARSYRRPMSVRAAREELARCAGGQFDPSVVRAFVAISLPRLLWRTGPLSILAQMPFLGPIPEAGRQVVASAGQGVTAATVAVGVAVGILGPGSGPGPIESPRTHRPSPLTSLSSGGSGVSRSTFPGIDLLAAGRASPPTTGRESARSRRAGGPRSGPSRPTDPSRGGSSERSGSGTGPGPSPEPSPSPSPSPSPTDPVPLPSVPLPSLPTPPLPTPDVPLSSVSVAVDSAFDE